MSKTKYKSFTQPIPAMIADDLLASLLRQFTLTPSEAWIVPGDYCAFLDDPTVSVKAIHCLPKEQSRLWEMFFFVSGYIAHWAQTMVATSSAASRNL